MHRVRGAVVKVSVGVVIGLSACGGDSRPRPSDSTMVANLAPPLTDVPLSRGEGRLHVDGGRIWYRVSGRDHGVPLMLLHGGPGIPSYGLKPLEALGDDRPVVRYDQLGAGKSDGLTDTTKMNVTHFVDELEALRAHLGYDQMHLLGHSWGALLAVAYYRAHPDHVASLTLAGAFLDVPAWCAHARALLKSLPDSLQRAVAVAEGSHMYDAPAYQAAVTAFDNRYRWLRPVQVDLDSTGPQINQPLYTYMQGPSEFTITGALRDYDATPYLKEIAVPTLYTVGQFDEANPLLVRRFASMTPGAKYALIRGAAHLTMWDNPTDMIAVVRQHLAAADVSNATKAAVTPP
jgi:proline iminopeptidase